MIKWRYKVLNLAGVSSQLQWLLLQLKITELINYVFTSRLTVVNREAKEEIPYNGLSTNACEYFIRTNLVKLKNAITDKPLTLALHYSR